MAVAAMQVASGAKGDVSVYQRARDHFAASMLHSYPVLVRGHGDEGSRGGQGEPNGERPIIALSSTPAEREVVQKRVELLHRAWTKDRNSLVPPDAGRLAHLDPALILTPPRGLEAGYVPIATRQELAGEANRSHDQGKARQ